MEHLSGNASYPHVLSYVSIILHEQHFFLHGHRCRWPITLAFAMVRIRFCSRSHKVAIDCPSECNQSLISVMIIAIVSRISFAGQFFNHCSAQFVSVNSRHLFNLNQADAFNHSSICGQMASICLSPVKMDSMHCPIRVTDWPLVTLMTGALPNGVLCVCMCWRANLWLCSNHFADLATVASFGHGHHLAGMTVHRVFGRTIRHCAAR